MEEITGRTAERKILNDALRAANAELIALYGRRRIGKTFLVRKAYEKQLAFEFSGVHNATMRQQLQNFSYALQRAMNSPAELAAPATWIAAFHTLEDYLAPIVKKQKTVIFFDEFPWIQTPRSNFLKAFDHFWNSWASKQGNLVVVVCGSAAAWMVKNIVKSKGGLHNRVTRRIRMLPFSLSETEAYLKSRGVRIDRYQTLQAYMCFGGVPQYLKDIQPGESVTQAIDRICFSKNGMLKDEFKILYASLFDNPAHHEALIRALAKVHKGMTRNELMVATGLTTGGTATNVLTELEESGFITPYIPFDKTAKDAIFRLTDEYSLFYIKYIEKARMAGSGTWLRISESAMWHSWSGYAFEAVCLKHVQQIKKALGIQAMHVQESGWRYVPGMGAPGAQIDLLLDRSDHCINVCEMKFSSGAFIINKKYSAELQQKQSVFKAKTKTRKTIFLTMITTYGVTKNEYYTSQVQNEVTMNALFK